MSSRRIISVSATVVNKSFTNSFNNFGYNNEFLDLHSEEAVIYENPATTQHENVTFEDAEAGFSYDLDDYADPTRMMQDSDDAELGNFFQRPVKIFEKEWGINITLAENINPWKLFFENPRVQNRIANFNLLRCNMQLKILVNGTPFHFGRLMVGYAPLDAYDETSPITGMIQQDLVQLSQRPHIFLDPTTSTGGTMELPFFWHKNYINIPDTEWNMMGELVLRTINTLQHANGGTDPVTISIFAWASQVSLAVPTTVEPQTLQPQAKEETISKGKGKSKSKGKMTAKSKPKNSVSAPPEHQQANSSGMISGPATAIAKAAGALKEIPILTPYATAAEFAADKTAAIAKLFGFSRPAVTKDPEPFKPVPVSNLAVTTVPDMVNKLTVDDQQALTIDTRVAGVGSHDTLSVKSIAGRESYLTTFTWSTGMLPETLLWNARVNPALWAESGSGPAKAYHFPACAMAALPFKYWTGSMKFRFQVVKSAFHKGRIKLVYDPNYFATTGEYNVNYLDVIDITEKDDFTITVGNGQGITLLEHLNPGADGVTEGYSTIPYTAANVGNGVLGMYVVNKLTTPSPAASDNIKINVYVSMGDDFEVFVPDQSFMDFTPFQPPATLLDNQADEQDIVPEPESSSRPVEPEECQLGPTLQYEDMINRVWTGESIQSLRPLLRRYVLWNAVGNGDSSDSVTALRLPAFPYYRGYDPNGVDSTAGAQKYNYCNNTLLHWVVLAHQGWRGGLRYKYLCRGQQDYATLYVQRHTIASVPNYNATFTSAPTYSNLKSIRADIVKDNSWAGNDTTAGTLGWQGNAYQTSYVNPNLEFESPFYHWARFLPGKRTNYLGAGKTIEGYDLRIFSKTKVSAVWDIHVAAAEDFQVYFFTGLPRMYRETAPPA